ncbi:MAG: hypothetical protein P8N02_08980, partial [Actinomycetota bacterium]|nr:hypothetical protein [Actinomycetota bacterium]
MDAEEELIDHHRRRIDRLIVNYWVVAAVAGLAVGVVLWLITPLNLIGLPVGVLMVLGVAGWLMSRSEAWLLASCGGVDVDGDAQARLVNMVEGLCASSGVAVPTLRLIDSDASNLVAVGRHHERSALVATSGLLASASRIELEALLANEISQIRTLDTAHVSAAATTLGLPALIDDVGRQLRSGRSTSGGSAGPLGRLGGVLALLAVPFAGVSRNRLAGELEPHRDFRTDLTGVQLTRYPPGMIAALERLDGAEETRLQMTTATAPLWVVDPQRSAASRPSV